MTVAHAVSALIWVFNALVSTTNITWSLNSWSSLPYWPYLLTDFLYPRFQSIAAELINDWQNVLWSWSSETSDWVSLRERLYNRNGMSNVCASTTHQPHPTQPVIQSLPQVVHSSPVLITVSSFAQQESQRMSSYHISVITPKTTDFESCLTDNDNIKH